MPARVGVNGDDGASVLSPPARARGHVPVPPAVQVLSLGLIGDYTVRVP